jgi:hypothetical protein
METAKIRKVTGIAALVCVIGVCSTAAQNLDFAVYSYQGGSTDSTLYRLYRCKSDGSIIWEKFFHDSGITEECNYRYGGDKIISKTCCFKRDSCFTWNYAYEEDKIILSRVIASPAFPDSVRYSEIETLSYPDSLTTIRFYERKGLKPLMQRERKRVAGKGFDLIGFDKDGKAIYTENQKADQYGISEVFREIPGNPQLNIRFRRFRVQRPQ